tara:strand:+ start:40 stop:384 length:345 start_codon:yes stop_codon:yes gene_type:complete
MKLIMKKILFSSFLILTISISNLVFFTSSSKADMKTQTHNFVLKAQKCYLSLPSYAQDGAIDSWLEAKKYWNDAVKETNMGDPRNLASVFYRNAQLYAGVVLQIGSAYDSPSCR